MLDGNLRVLFMMLIYCVILLYVARNFVLPNVNQFTRHNAKGVYRVKQNIQLNFIYKCMRFILIWSVELCVLLVYTYLNLINFNGTYKFNFLKLLHLLNRQLLILLLHLPTTNAFLKPHLIIQKLNISGISDSNLSAYIEWSSELQTSTIVLRLVAE